MKTQKLISHNPHDQSVVGEVNVSTKTDVENIVKKAKQAFSHWKQTPIDKRAAYLAKFHTLLSRNKEGIALLMTQEMGKPINQSRNEITAELGFIEWYVQNAYEALGEKVIKKTETNTYKLRYEPYGVCASITPWNFPVTMASSGMCQQILAGNVVILKPSEYTPLTQKRFVELLNQIGLPQGVVTCLFGDGTVGKQLIDSDIDLVWFTGSTSVGQEINQKCAKKFIKCILELGGSSPGIVFADCDIDKTVEELYIARFLNCGQVCNAVKRLFVEQSIFQQIVQRLTRKLESVQLGDPLKSATDIGPLVSKEQRQTLESQVTDAIQKGAKIVIGGERPRGKEFSRGFYYSPTILTNVTPEMQIYKEETFGPVLPIMPFTTESEVVKLANQTEYGLSAEIYTTDRQKAENVAHQLEAGIIGINTDNYYVPFCPSGGYKKSGLGREYGVEGFRELTQIKYICISK